MGKIAQDAAKSAKQLAIDAAKRAARESNEVLKEGAKQVLGAPESAPSQVSQEQPVKNSEEQMPEEILEAQLNAQKTARLAELEREVLQISKVREQRDAEKKRQKMMAEAAKSQKEEPLAEPASKHSRKFGEPRKKIQNFLEKLKTKSEIRMPPSG